MGRTTNKQRRATKAASARERAAAARAVQKQQEQRRRAFTIIGSVVGVAVVIAVIAFVAINHKSSSPSTRTPVTATVLHDVTSVSPATLTTIGQGSAQIISSATKSTDKALVVNGKPELLYVGGEFCPYCAAERWSMIQALSKFGTFTGLSEIRSAADDGDLPTFTFYKSTYSSPYLAFTPVENENRSEGQLQKLTSAQQALFTEYTDGFPFLDFGGKFVQKTAGYSPTLLTGKNQAQVASVLDQPSNSIAKGVDGEGNILTATLCVLTKDKPASVCDTPAVTALQAKVNATNATTGSGSTAGTGS